MKALDRTLQRWRIRVAAQWIAPNSRVLDVGCFDSALFESLGSKLREGIGLDPLLEASVSGSRWELRPGRLPGPHDLSGEFDAITMLAVLEHIPEHDLDPLARECARLLALGGRLILTVPEARVDLVLAWFSRLRLIDGMSLEEHHGFSPSITPGIFEPYGLTLEKHRHFQAGFNNLFVFVRR